MSDVNRVIELTVLLVLPLLIAGAVGAADFESSPAGIFAVPESTAPDAAKTFTGGGGAKLSSADCDIEINFDEAAAPLAFLSTTRLTEAYAASGVHFEGPGGNDGGAVLDDSTWGGITGQSSPNFLAFHSGGDLSDGGVPTGPEIVRFDEPAVFFEAAFASGVGGTLTLRAYNAAGNLVDVSSETVNSTFRRMRVMGRNITHVEFNCDAVHWLADDFCIIKQGGAGVLYLFDDCLSSPDLATPALANLGYTDITIVTDENEFEFAIRTGQWNLIILENYGHSLSDAILDALYAYHLNDGGRIIFSSYDLLSHPGHALLGSMGVTVVDSYTTPLPVYNWGSTALFDSPNTVPDLTPLLNSCTTDGIRLTATTATVAAGYTASEQAGEAAVTINTDQRIIVNAFIPGLVEQDADSDGKNDMVELYENEIYFMTGAGDASLTAAPSSLAFKLPVDSVETQPVTLQNNSDVPIDWNSGTARVLFVCANVPGSFLTELRREPGIGIVDYVNARFETPDLATLRNYDVVIVASNYYFLDGVALGDALADYVDAGGKVIHSSSSSYTGFHIAGRFESGGYAAFNLNTATDFSLRNLGTYDAAHPIMAGISTLQNLYGFPVTLKFGAVLVASWDSGAPMVAVQGDSIVGIDLFVPGLTPQYSGDVSRLFRNAVLWLRGGSPLTVSPESGTLAPGETATVDITADAAGLPLGASEKLLAGFKGLRGGAAAVDISLLVISACMDDASFSQRPTMPAEPGWGASTSNEGSLWKCFENFSGLAEPVAALRWWGMDAVYSVGWSECDRPEPDTFRVSFYEDNIGQPGNLVKELVVQPTVVDTGLLGQGSYNFKEYEAVLPEKVRLDQGWISIEGADTGSCWFLWVTSPDGTDGYVQFHASDPPLALSGGLSLCIVTDPECTPIADISCNTSTPGTTVGEPAFNDVYPCAGWNAAGPEAVYRFVPAADGQVEISLTDIAVDLDLYLLEGQCLPAHCVAFGDDALTFTATGGTEYFVLVDGEDVAGGSFVLHVACASGEGEGEGACAPDTAAPVLTLVGDPSMTLYLCPGDPVPMLPGAIAGDDCDGDLTSAIVVGGDAVVTAPGVYKITYNVSDSSGNPAISLKRIVTVEAPTGDNLLLQDYAATVECGDAFTPPQAEVRNGCGAPGGTVSTADTVDTHVAGNYTLNYTHSGAEAVAMIVSVRDTTVPAITLTGAAAVALECGSAYTDAGATATDGCDGDLTASISAANAVDTTVPGNYTVTYSVSDSAGNAAAPVTRTVTVSDATGPVITLLGDAAVTVDCSATYTDAGATATDGCTGDLTASISVNNPVDTAVPGEYTVTYSVSDAAGNAAAPVTRTVTVLDNCAGCCAQGCQGCGPKVDGMKEFRRFLGDYLLVGLSIIGLFLLSGARR